MVDWQAQRQLMAALRRMCESQSIAAGPGGPGDVSTPLPLAACSGDFLPWTLVRRGLKEQVIAPLRRAAGIPGRGPPRAGGRADGARTLP